jgi:hypothetical protein
MSVKNEGGVVVVDNANSGTNAETTIEAAKLARRQAGVLGLTLVIGTVTGEGAVCEGFPPDQIAAAIGQVRPERIIWVGDSPRLQAIDQQQQSWEIAAQCTTLEEARRIALQKTTNGSIVLAVKTWR